MNSRKALVLLAVTTALAGCASAPSAPQAAASTPPKSPPVPCSKAPASTVSAALSLPVEAPKEINNDPVTVCTYLPKAKSYAVVVRFQTDVTAAIFQAGTSGNLGTHGAPQALPGFQDQAYAGTNTGAGITTNTVAARKGTVEIVVTSTASINAEKTLVDQLFKSL